MLDPCLFNGRFAHHSSELALEFSVIKIDPTEQLDPSRIWD
jgi:hypothetical protein